MKSNLLKKLVMARSKAVRLEKMFPMSRLRRALPGRLEKIVLLSLAGQGSMANRVKISWRFITFLMKMNKHHGSTFTVKWLKANRVALQKYLGDDKLSSLRELEPNLPLPRLINGFPAIIDAKDRKLIREGHHGILRFWMSLFGIYRIIIIPGQTKVNSIYDPFKGSMPKLLSMIEFIKVVRPGWGFHRLGIDFSKFKLAPRTFVLSHKASPSNAMSYQGLLTDLDRLTKGNSEQRRIWENLNKYIDVLRESKFSLARWDSLIEGLTSIHDTVQASPHFSFPSKKSEGGTGLSQFAIKEEAAGKIRVFALVDSITQSVIAPLHDALFHVLKQIPNDGTFDQDKSVERSTEKSIKYKCAYSFDLSSATDRLPARLIAAVLESLTGVPGLGNAWFDVLVDRSFHFGHNVKKKFPNLLIDQGNEYRYSVGQPMGGLSSWAGLAITHHWILQYCSHLNGNLTTWEDRYEILGDDIVIFDSSLAKRYLEVMEELGVDINVSKSISSISLPVFEFAMRFIVNGTNVSSLSFQQVFSSSSLAARVADAYSYTKLGLVKSVNTLANLFTRTIGKNSFRNLKEVGLPAISLLGLLHSKELVEHRVVIEALINPRYEEFDWEKADFQLPLRAILQFELDVLNGLWNGTYPFSKEELRREIADELHAELSAIVLQHALYKAKILLKDYEALLENASSHLVRLIDHRAPWPEDEKILKYQLSGFFQDIIEDWDKDTDILEFVESVEDALYEHAKYSNVTFEKALDWLDQTEAVIYKWTYKTETSRVKYETEKSVVIDMVRKSVWGSKTPYWRQDLSIY